MIFKNGVKNIQTAVAVLRSDSMKRNYEGLIFNLPLALAVLTRTHASHLNSYSISGSSLANSTVSYI